MYVCVYTHIHTHTHTHTHTFFPPLFFFLSLPHSLTHTHTHTHTDAGTFGSSGYGAKASEKLMTVRGKDFRHEKTKKKRGNYRGGTISLASNSIKYPE